jgi:uncharacterized protein
MSSAKKPLVDSEEHYGIKILRDGTWLYQGTPINRINMVRLFSSVLKKDERGDYWLVTPYEKGRIEVEDVPFMAVEMKIEKSGQEQILHFRTNIDDWVRAGHDHPLRMSGEGAPYILVRDDLEARVSRAVYYDLVAMAVPEKSGSDVMGVWSGGIFFPIGKAAA